MIREDDGAAGRTFPLGQYLGGLLGGVFVPLPNVAMEPDVEMMQRVSAVMLETAEAIEEARKAWLDNMPGEITRQERGCA